MTCGRQRMSSMLPVNISGLPAPCSGLASPAIGNARPPCHKSLVARERSVCCARSGLIPLLAKLRLWQVSQLQPLPIAATALVNAEQNRGQQGDKTRSRSWPWTAVQRIRARPPRSHLSQNEKESAQRSLFCLHGSPVIHPEKTKSPGLWGAGGLLAVRA